MILQTARFLAFVATGLAAGAALCVVFLDRSFAGDGAQYAEYKQLSIRALTIPLPLLGVLGSVCMATDLLMTWKGEDALPLWLGVAALALSVVAGVLTRFVHFPINDQVMTWTQTSVPASWTSIRDRWAFVHVIRTAVTVAAFAILAVMSSLRSA